MKPLRALPPARLEKVRYVFSDVDGTITDDETLPAEAYAALHRLSQAGIEVILVTAASAGWCDQMARLWPVTAVVAENGGLYITYDRARHRSRVRYFDAGDEPGKPQNALDSLIRTVVRSVPGADLADDQPYRRTSVAFRRPTDPAELSAIREALEHAGARSTVNSMWVLGWLGDYDKLTMVRRLAAEILDIDLAADPDIGLYVGDSANDSPLFGFFPLSIGVSTVVRDLDRMPNRPQWVTEGAGGKGFVEVSDALLSARRRP